ncbi:MAG TPA: dephospho-CoA kinase [Dehalococcoidales bacterium]|nr:dephospho-CoA kinase [Dehalococcoidales bacterium]
MEIIILTGTIGSGKSTAAGILRELGAAVIDSDEIARQVIAPGSRAYAEVIEAFGTDIVVPDSGIDRKKLAARVFSRPEDLSRLNRIIHPRVDELVESHIRQYQDTGRKAVFVEMAIIAGASWQERVDQVWVIKVSRSVALRRLEKRGLSRSEALARLANQPPPEKSGHKNLIIIQNNGTPDELRQQLTKLWEKIIKKRELRLADCDYEQSGDPNSVKE